MADLDWAALADYARLDGDGTLTVVGAHRCVVGVPALPAQQVLAAAGRVWLGRREPAALLSLSATTPGGDVGVVAEFEVPPSAEQAGPAGRLSACFAVALVAPVEAVGDYSLVVSLNGDRAAELPFAVVLEP